MEQRLQQLSVEIERLRNEVQVQKNEVQMQKEVFEKQLSIQLDAANKRFDTVTNSASLVVGWIGVLGTVAAVLSAAFVGLSWYSSRNDYQHERDVYERRMRDFDNNYNVASIQQQQLANLHKALAEQNVRVGDLQLGQLDKKPATQFEGIENVNNVIDVVKQTLAFRLEQEKTVAGTLKAIEKLTNDRDRQRRQRLHSATTILNQLILVSRMDFAALSEEQQKRGIRLTALVDDLHDFLPEQGVDIQGRLLYTCGVVTYYDNDVVEAKAYLNRAAQCRVDAHQAELDTNQDYRQRFGFIHYFRALVEKNWGELPEALHEIEQSAKILAGNVGEFLTPVTKAEILSYIPGDEERSRNELHRLIKQATDLETALQAEGKNLNANQSKLRNRMYVLLGNTYFVQKMFTEARMEYLKATEFNSQDYYALSSVAQCDKVAGNGDSAGKYFRRCVEAIELSGDLRKKRERITRAVISVIATNSAAGCDDATRRNQYRREARELLTGDLSVGDLTPKFFSPTTKRLVNASALLQEVD